MAGPIDGRLLRRGRATRNFLAALTAVGVVTSVLVIAQARLISDAIAHVFASHRTDGVLRWAGLLALVFLARAALGWAGEVLAHRAAADVKSGLRHDLLAARLARPQNASAPTGTLVTLVTEGLDDLDGYYAKYLPQVLLAGSVPLIVGITIATQDIESAVIIAITIPLIPLFMALIGWSTQTQVARRLRVATRLANHFADLVTGLSTLQVFGRARAQLTGLRATENAHRAETMRTLRVTFLSSFALELLATISVALVAVSVGFRVVFAEMDLRTALFILILAPEAYLPVRQVGVHFHDAADGMAAADAAGLPRAVFSAIVPWISPGTWPTQAIADRQRSASRSTSGVPPTSTRPEVGCRNPATTASAVDLPPPDGPARATISPGATVRLSGARASAGVPG